MNAKPSEPITGGCLCGAVQYRIEAPVGEVVHCHCAMCRHGSGAPVMTWAVVPREAFTLTRGELAAYRSSDHGERRFCPRCGAQVLFLSTREPETFDVALGTLERPDEHPAGRHIWTESRIRWLHLDEQLPALARETASGG